MPAATTAGIYTREQIIAQREAWRREGKKVVLTNGCYDILHPGHVWLLDKAHSLGDVLVLALNTDSSVQRLKGTSRPFFSEAERVEMASHLAAVDAIALFDEDTPQQLIADVLPDVLVKGADWVHFVAGAEEVKAAGGQVVTVPLEPGFSTTNIAEKIASRYATVPVNR
jgi:rfaE bifunctional protein nucleotidyltransferase chain/domain